MIRYCGIGTARCSTMWMLSLIHIFKRNGVRVDNLDQVHVPDPVAQELCCMMLRIEQLERENAELEKERGKREET